MARQAPQGGGGGGDGGNSMDLLWGVAFVVAIGPALTQFLSAYRGVVLELRDDEVFVARTDRPPLWMSLEGLASGQVFAKERLTWSPAAAEPTPDDKKLLDLHAFFVNGV